MSAAKYPLTPRTCFYNPAHRSTHAPLTCSGWYTGPFQEVKLHLVGPTAKSGVGALDILLTVVLAAKTGDGLEQMGRGLFLGALSLESKHTYSGLQLYAMGYNAYQSAIAKVGKLTWVNISLTLSCKLVGVFAVICAVLLQNQEAQDSVAI